MKLKNLSVFFPCFNEAGNIVNTTNKAIEVLKTLGLEWEIIIVNDGSTDATAKIAQKLAEKNSHIRIINQANGGYGMALRAGFTNARYDTICYTDGDGQFDFSQVTKFIEKMEVADLIIGVRIKREDPLIRSIFQKGWALTLFIFFRLNLKDVDCGFKMIKRRVLDEIGPLESKRGGMINAELVIKAMKAGFKITEVGVNHYPRLKGKPTGASLRVIIQSYLDLIKLWWKFK